MNHWDGAYSVAVFPARLANTRTLQNPRNSWWLSRSSSPDRRLRRPGTSGEHLVSSPEALQLMRNPEGAVARLAERLNETHSVA